MFTDITGKRRLKISLHAHTTRSDGRKTPEEAAALYKAAGYDAVAFTDHWVYGPADNIGGLPVLSGCEYNLAGCNTPSGVWETFHVVGLDMEHDPGLSEKEMADDAVPLHDRVRQTAEAIRRSGGLAILAHPAWSLNTPEQIMACGAFDALEIYNSVSGYLHSARPYSGLITDMLATQGVIMPLLATDDAHYYTGDELKGWIAAEADAVEKLGLAEAIRQGKFYATQGPEVHLQRLDDNTVRLRCTPAVKVVFFSNLPFSKGRIVRGECITEIDYAIKHDRFETYIRAEVTDESGLCAWSNIIQA